jgi:hypothetical protein
MDKNQFTIKFNELCKQKDWSNLTAAREYHRLSPELIKKIFGDK